MGRATDRRLPTGGMTRAVPPARVPSNVGHAVVLGRSEELNVLTPLCRVLGLLGRLVGREVEVPEFNVALLGRLESGEDDLATSGRPKDPVARFVVEGF
jgi:hypothetical protein